MGHIDEESAHLNEDKIIVIKNDQLPKNKAQLKQMLGMANYRAKFVPNYAEILVPVT